VHAAYLQVPDNHSTHRMEVGSGQGRGCVQAATQLPVLHLILREGAGVDARVGRAWVMGQWGLEWKVGDVVTTPFWKNGASRWMLKEIFIILGCPILCFS